MCLQATEKSGQKRIYSHIKILQMRKLNSEKLNDFTKGLNGRGTHLNPDALIQNSQPLPTTHSASLACPKSTLQCFEKSPNQ